MPQLGESQPYGSAVDFESQSLRCGVAGGTSLGGSKLWTAGPVTQPVNQTEVGQRLWLPAAIPLQLRGALQPVAKLVPDTPPINLLYSPDSSIRPGASPHVPKSSASR